VATLKDSWEFRTGRVTELKVATRLRNGGCLISVVNDGGDVAPLLHGWAQDLVLPDLQCWWPGGLSAWVECKFKSTCGVYQRAGIPTTGIDRSKYVHYAEVQERTGHPVLLVFVQREQDGVFLAELGKDLVASAGAGRSMVFWDLTRLQQLCSYEELMATPAARQQLEMPLFYPSPLPPKQGRLPF
jgi:hypothetical protein